MSNNCLKATRSTAPLADVRVSVEAGAEGSDGIIEVQGKQVIEAALLEKPGLSSRLTEFEAIDEEDGTLKGRSGAMPALKLSLR